MCYAHRYNEISTRKLIYSYYPGDKAKVNAVFLIGLRSVEPLQSEAYRDLNILGLMGYLGEIITQYPSQCKLANRIIYDFTYTIDTKGFPTEIEISETQENQQTGEPYTNTKTITLEWE